MLYYLVAERKVSERVGSDLLSKMDSGYHPGMTQIRAARVSKRLRARKQCFRSGTIYVAMYKPPQTPKECGPVNSCFNILYTNPRPGQFRPDIFCPERKIDSIVAKISVWRYVLSREKGLFYTKISTSLKVNFRFPLSTGCWLLLIFQTHFLKNQV